MFLNKVVMKMIDILNPFLYGLLYNCKKKPLKEMVVFCGAEFIHIVNFGTI